jgi:hypothetical protein
MLALGILLAATIGLALGLLGGGGAILTVPALVYVFGVGAKPAIVMSLAVVGITSLMGAALHHRLGNVRIDVAATFGSVAMAGAYVGARLAAPLSAGVQLVLLAIVMLSAAASMLRSARTDAVAGGSPRPGALLPVGFGVGVLTGLVGVGGGFLLVPSLVVFGRLPMRQAVGTSLLVIAMNSAAGLAGHAGAVTLDWWFLARFTGAAALGAIGGTALGARVPQAMLKRGFAVLLLAVGGFVLYENRDALHVRSPEGPPVHARAIHSARVTSPR